MCLGLAGGYRKPKENIFKFEVIARLPNNEIFVNHIRSINKWQAIAQMQKTYNYITIVSVKLMDELWMFN